MPLARIAQVLTREMEQGWTAELVTAAGAEVVEVKDTPGKVARVVVNTGAINVTLQDDGDAMWAPLTSAAELNLIGTPMQFNDNIELAFSGAGNAWILYK